MSLIVILSFVVVVPVAVWAVFVVVRWEPERGYDNNNWYESGIGRSGRGGPYTS